MGYDAIIIGSGPNGLSAAIVLARAGLSVLVREASESAGGGARTLELTLPGFLHDAGSAVHPMAAASSFFRSLALERFGLEWIHPPAPLVHPLDGESAAVLENSLTATADTLSLDGMTYEKLMQPLVQQWDAIVSEIFSPPLHLPAHPLVMAEFGMRALLPASVLNGIMFRGHRAKALFAGLACHSVLALDKAGTSAVGLVLGAAGHKVGWPIPRGGAQKITDALLACLRSLGGVIETGAPVRSLEELPASRAVLFDLSPHQVARIAARQLSKKYLMRLNRFRYGPGIFKIDWALSGPIPWKDPECTRSVSLHLGGSAAEMAAGERDAWTGRHSDKPFVLFAQPSLFDPQRAPEGRHTGWAYCHVPNGSTKDMTAVIEAQVERFAPGFRDVILARSTRNTAEMEAWNENLIGGDIVGGANTLKQILFRPTISLDPYRMPAEGLYLCSSSTPPGAGVHGMCGYNAAQSALKHTFGLELAPHN